MRTRFQWLIGWFRSSLHYSSSRRRPGPRRARCLQGCAASFAKGLGPGLRRDDVGFDLLKFSSIILASRLARKVHHHLQEADHLTIPKTPISSGSLVDAGLARIATSSLAMAR
jgi:hypothetical protein